MKKFLFLILSVAFIQIASAQTHVIEVIGRGVLGETNPVVTYDPTDVVKVEVEAIYFNYPAETPADVSFNGQVVQYSDVDFHSSVGATVYENIKGYYRAELTTLPGDGEIELDKNGNGNDIVSFYIYVYRNRDGLPYSMINPEPEIAFLHAMGESSENSVEAEFSLENATGLRDITVTVPISDNEHEGADNRIGVIQLWDNGDVLKTLTFALNTGFDNFYLQQVFINNVQPDVETVTVQIYSPVNPPEPEPRVGDSFYAGTILMDVEEQEEEGRGCTYTQGYWKTHSEKYGPASKPDYTWDKVGGPDAILYEAGDDYPAGTWHEVWQTSPGGNPYYQLAHQYMAAVLNLEAGASTPSEVDAAMALSSPIIDAGPYANVTIKVLKNGKEKMVIVDKELAAEMIRLAGIFTDYNEGEIGPGHCDDGEEIESDLEKVEETATVEGKGKGKGKNKSGQIEDEISDKLTVYPNPVRNISTISFTPRLKGRVTVDLYNSMGQKMNRLMDQNVSDGINLRFKINGQDYNEGLYILRVQNESAIFNTRIQISR